MPPAPKGFYIKKTTYKKVIFFKVFIDQTHIPELGFL
jgi:hypothetical protein